MRGLCRPAEKAESAALPAQPSPDTGTDAGLTSKRPDDWMHFAEFFAVASSRAIDDKTAATALLASLRSSRSAPAVVGYKRGWAWDQAQAVANNADAWRELPRASAPARIPQDVWRDFETVEETGKSYWNDDEEKPLEYTSVDWLGGAIDIHKWHRCPIYEPYRVEYRFLRLDAGAAREILARMGISARGRPPSAGGYRQQDTIIIGKMHKLIRSTPGLSRYAAALEFAKEAGGATEASRVRRLVDRYNARYGR